MYKNICLKQFKCVYLWRLHYEVLHQKFLITGQTYMLLSRLWHSETLKAHWLVFTGPVNTRLPLFTLT